MVRRSIWMLALAGCAPMVSSGPPDAGPAMDAFVTPDAPASPDAFAPSDAFVAMDVGPDANDACIVDYNVGHCISTTTCSAMSGYSSTAGLCPGPADIQCCSLTPDVASNPPTPSGYRLMMQSEVTTPMTDWAVMILHDGATYPMFSETTMTFAAASGGGTVDVLARVEWHPPDFLNSATHRGVTLYVPI